MDKRLLSRRFRFAATPLRRRQLPNRLFRVIQMRASYRRIILGRFVHAQRLVGIGNRQTLTQRVRRSHLRVRLSLRFMLSIFRLCNVVARLVHRIVRTLQNGVRRRRLFLALLSLRKSLLRALELVCGLAKCFRCRRFAAALGVKRA